MAIYPCKDCVPPKRYPGCHDHCQEYKDVKAKASANRYGKPGSRDAAMYTVETMMKCNDFNVKKKRSGRLTYSRKG